MGTMKHWALAAAAAVGLALAGCGGGGGGGATKPTLKPVSLTGVPMKGTFTATPDGGQPLKADGTHTSGNVTFTCASDAGAGGCTLFLTAAGGATYTGGTVTAAYSQAYLHKQDNKRKADLAEANKLLAAIDATATVLKLQDQNTDGFRVDSGKVTKRPDTDPDFAKSATGPAALGGGWMGATFTQTTADDASTTNIDESKTVTVTAYTDKAANGPAAYSTYYADSHPGTDDYAAWIQAIDDVSAAGLITFGTNTVSDTESVLFSFAHGLTARNQRLTFPNDTELDGSFHGVPGKFTCASGCEVTSGDTAKFSGFGGTWTFTPTATGADLNNVNVAGVKKDRDYLDFGYWTVADKNGSADRFRVGTFAQGMREFGAVGGVVTGTASYSGKAAGLYVKKLAFDPDTGALYRAQSGQFTADATLNAAFGGTSIAEAKQLQVTGSISNFMDGSKDLGWTLMLNNVAADDDDDLQRAGIQNIQSDGAFSGLTSGGADGAAGAWSGKFYGDPAGDMPGQAAGVFTGHFADGHVAGAFGANKQ